MLGECCFVEGIQRKCCVGEQIISIFIVPLNV